MDEAASRRIVERFWRAMNSNDWQVAGPWRFTVNRVVGDEEGAASDVAVTDGAVEARVVSFFAMRAGLIWRVTEFWPEPFAAAGWRAAWVEQVGRSGATG